MTELLSVVLPFRNQADHLEAVLESYPAALAATGEPFEIIAVPNASSDGTDDAVARVARRCPGVRIAPNPPGGWGRSVLVGLAAARGTRLCYANSARTDPAWIPPLLRLHRDNDPCVAKVVRARRAAPLREAGSWLYNLEARLLFGVRAGDVNGTPKLLSRELYERLGLSSPDDLLDLELMAKAARLGVRIVEMETAGFRRHGGRSMTGFRSAWKMYAGALRLRASLGGFARSPGG
jgi:glycosyltransferase involved in cell wall biosynthesis